MAKRLYADKNSTDLMQSAEQGDKEAMYELSIRYRVGIGGCFKDLERARFWLFEAANNNHGEAQCMLGETYKREIEYGLDKDLEKSSYWYQKSVDNGGIGGLVHFAFNYANGKGIPKDLEKVKHWLKLCAEQYDVHVADADDYSSGLCKKALKALTKFNNGATSIKEGGCYIATCVYGSYDCPEVWTSVSSATIP